MVFSAVRASGFLERRQSACHLGFGPAGDASGDHPRADEAENELRHVAEFGAPPAALKR